VQAVQAVQGQPAVTSRQTAAASIRSIPSIFCFSCSIRAPEAVAAFSPCPTPVPQRKNIQKNGKNKNENRKKNSKNLKEKLFSYCFLSISVLKKSLAPCHIQDKSAVKKDAYSVRNPAQDTISFQINSPLPRCSKMKVISSVVFEIFKSVQTVHSAS